MMVEHQLVVCELAGEFYEPAAITGIAGSAGPLVILIDRSRVLSFEKKKADLQTVRQTA